MDMCLACRVRLAITTYLCADCEAGMRRSTRTADRIGVSAPAACELSAEDTCRLRDFALAVGLEAVEEIAARDAAMRRLDAVLRRAATLPIPTEVGRPGSP